MADNTTLATIRDRARKRADMENSSFWTDAQITAEINASIKRLYAFLVESYKDDYFYATTTVASVAGTADYALPADFYKLLGVDVGQGANPSRWVRLTKFRLAQRNTRPNQATYLRDYKYRLKGSNISFIPTPQAGLTFQLHYVPTFTALSADADPFDTINGYDDLVVLDVARKLLQSEESDTSEVEREMRERMTEIRQDAETRDAGEPGQVTDVYEIPYEEDFEGYFL